MYLYFSVAFVSYPISLLCVVLCVYLSVSGYLVLNCITDIPTSIGVQSVAAYRGTSYVTSTIYSFITSLRYAGWPLQQDFADIIFLLKCEFWMSER